MGKFIKNHWARLIILTAAAYQVAAGLAGFFWPKIFWDWFTKLLDPAFKPIPILQIINVLFGLIILPGNGLSDLSLGHFFTKVWRLALPLSRSPPLLPFLSIRVRTPKSTISLLWLYISGGTVKARSSVLSLGLYPDEEALGAVFKYLGLVGVLRSLLWRTGGVLEPAVPSEYLTTTIINSGKGPISTSHAVNAGAPTPIWGDNGPGTIAVGGTIAFAVRTGRGE